MLKTSLKKLILQENNLTEPIVQAKEDVSNIGYSKHSEMGRPVTEDATNTEFDEIAPHYKEAVEDGMILAGSSHDYFVKYKLHYIKPLLKGIEHPKILDYGCGVGLLSQAIDESFDSVVIHGFDVSQDSIDNIDRSLMHGENRFTSNLGDLDNNYDLALLVTVLHHVPIEERPRVVQNIHSRLKPGGLLVVIEHNMANPLTRKSVDSCEFDKGAVMLDRKECIDLISKHFVNLKSRYITFWPQQLSFMQPTDRVIGWIPFGAQFIVCGQRDPA